MYRVGGVKNKLEIRTINDVRGNIYDIFEVLYFDNMYNRWRSLCTYFSYEDAIEFNKIDVVEDKRSKPTK